MIGSAVGLGLMILSFITLSTKVLHSYKWSYEYPKGHGNLSLMFLLFPALAPDSRLLISMSKMLQH